MAVTDELSVRISAQVADFQAGAQRVESKLGDLSTEALQTSGAMEVLSNRADDAGDNISQTGRRASTTAGQLNILQGATTGANASFMGISATMWGSLIPAVTALGAALAPVVGALGGFVAVAGSIAAVGLLPAIGGILTHTESLKNELQGLKETVLDTFGPIFDIAAGALQILIGDFENMLQTLSLSEGRFARLATEFVGLGRAIIDVIPAFVEMAITITEDFLPPFVDWMNNILPQIPDMLMGLVNIFERMIPKFQEAGSTLLEFLGPLTEFGFTVLDVLGPALEMTVDKGTRVLEWFNDLDQNLQKAGASLSLLAPVITGIASLLGGPITAALAATGGAAVLLARRFNVSIRDVSSWLQRLWFDIKTFATNARTAIENFIAGLNFNNLQRAGNDLMGTLGRLWVAIRNTIPPAKEAFMAFIDGVDLQALAQDGIEFAEVLTERLDQTIQDLLPVLKDMQTFLSENKEEFRTIGSAVGTFARFMANVATTIVEVLGPAFNKVVIPAIRLFIDYLDWAIGNLTTLINLMGEIRAGDWTGAAEIIAGTNLEAPPEPTQDLNMGQATQQIQSDIRLVLEENTDIVNSRIEQGAERVQRRTTRRTRRNTGGPTGL